MNTPFDHEQGLQKRLSRVVLSDVHDTAPKVSATRLTLTCDKLGPPRARAALANEHADEMREKPRRQVLGE